MFERLLNSILPQRAELARQREARRIITELTRQTDSLTKKDVATWRRAWQSALSIENPNRQMLYDIYQDCLVDLHLLGCIGQRKGMVFKTGYRLVKADGTEDERASALIQAEWFRQYCHLVLDTRYWGHSLIQFGDVVQGADGLTFERVELVPRKHVCPEYGVVLRMQGDDWHSGIPFREGDLAAWCIEAGQPYDLGLLLAIAPQCISKKNMMAFWDMFGEIFGAPMRIAKATTTDDNERKKIANALERMGAAFWGLFPDGTDIEIKESAREDAFNVYDRRINRCNSEMSKGILNQTMTIDNGSSLSQSATHLEVFENVVRDDKRMLASHVNDHLLPFMEQHGFPVRGLHFAWDDAVAYTPEQQNQTEQTVLARYEVDPKYFVEKYGIPITGERKQPEMLPADGMMARLLQHATGGDPDFFA